MNENVNKHIEALVDKAMKDSALEAPSFDFTSKVMQQVTATSKSIATVYEPLISKKGWFMVCASVLALVAYVFITEGSQGDTWLHTIDTNVISKLKFSNPFSGFKLSTTTMYAIVMLVAMLFIQYFDKRLEAK
jgi:hypothetical protein